MGEYESDAAFFSDEYRFTFEWNRKEKGEKKITLYKNKKREV